jgi:Ca-activated chloride channel family protein
MRSHAILVPAALLGVLGTGLSSQQSPVFKAGTQIVPIYVTVTDAERRLVPGLTIDDFKVFDNEQPQPISFFDNQIQPITVVVMLDTSASMTMALDLLRAAAQQFLIRLLPADRGKVGAFNDKIEVSATFTADRDALIAELEHLDFGNPTRLYDAIDVSLDELAGVEGRRVVLVFTDGADTGSRTGSRQVLDRARREEVMIYAIGLQSEIQGQRTRPDGSLKRFAEETGGGYFELKKTDELGSTFTRVAQELHSQYVVGFTPAVLDGKTHKLEVKLSKPGMTARARKSYVAAATAVDSSSGR